MSIIKKLSLYIIFCTITPCFAEPPFQILRTCMDNEPFEKRGTITELDGDAKKSLAGCEDQFDRTIDGHLYGTIRCKDKFYMIIRDKMMDPEKAVNHSMNPEINPGVEFTTSSL